MKASFPRLRCVDPRTDPPDSIVQDSVYVLILGNDIVGILLALSVVAAQFWVLGTFGWSKWGQDGSESGGGQSLPARFKVLGVILVFLHLGSELLKGLQLCWMGFPWKERQQHRPQALLPGGAILSVTCVTLGVAINYIVNISENVVALIQDVFILLFVLEIDEKCLSIVRYYDPIWTRALMDDIATSYKDGVRDSSDGATNEDAVESPTS